MSEDWYNAAQNQVTQKVLRKPVLQTIILMATTMTEQAEIVPLFSFCCRADSDGGSPVQIQNDFVVTVFESKNKKPFIERFFYVFISLV